MIEGTMNRVAWQSPTNRNERDEVASMAFRMGSGILGSNYRPPDVGPHAFHQLATQYLLQAGAMVQLLGGGERFAPAAAEAQWSASLDSEHTGNIDLGDGYTLQLDERDSQITILNANTGERTRIWGDPHVEIDGNHAFDFWGTTTFTLENGTKVTIDTEQWGENPNAFVASAVTITKEDRAIRVEGISQNALGDLSVSVSNDGRALDAATRDGFVLNENAQGSGWRSDLTGEVATQADLDVTRPGELYGPGSVMPSFDDIRSALGAYLFFGIAVDVGITAAERQIDRIADRITDRVMARID